MDNSNQLPNSVVNYDRVSHILILDDDDSILKFFKIHLNKFFSKVVVVRHPKEVATVLKTKEIDLVLIDIYLSTSNGFQVMKKIRKFDPAIPVLLISGAALSDKDEAEIKKADGFLSKPFSMDELHDFIKMGLSKRHKIKSLVQLLSDKNDLKILIKGKVKPEKFIDKANLKEAKVILEDLKLSA